MWLRPEHHLLGLAGTLPRGPEATAALAGLAWERIDWDYTLWAAERLRALPLLGVALERSGAERPPEVDSRCRLAREQGALRGLVTERIVREVKSSFERDGVPFMILKGLPLALELYGDTALRPCADIDILVPGGCRDRAIESIARLGFHLPARSLSLGFYRRHHFHITMVRRPGRDLPVELHWDIQPFFSRSHIPEAQFWSNGRTGRIGSVKVTIPGREATYLYLTQHLARHLLDLEGEGREDPIALLLEPGRQGHLTWLTDLVLLADSPPPLDWGRIGGLARAWGLEEDLEAGLRLARSLDPAHMPSEVCGTGAAQTRGMRRARRIAEVFPRLARTSERLQLRPILALDLLWCAFPGAAAVRSRYGLTGASNSAVLWRGTLHAGRMLAKAVRFGADSLLELIWQAFRRSPGLIHRNETRNSRSAEKNDNSENLHIHRCYRTGSLYTSGTSVAELSDGSRSRGGDGREGGSVGETRPQALSDAKALMNGPSSRWIVRWKH